MKILTCSFCSIWKHASNKCLSNNKSKRLNWNFVSAWLFYSLCQHSSTLILTLAVYWTASVARAPTVWKNYYADVILAARNGGLSFQQDGWHVSNQPDWEIHWLPGVLHNNFFPSILSFHYLSFLLGCGGEITSSCQNNLPCTEQNLLMGLQDFWVAWATLFHCDASMAFSMAKINNMCIFVCVCISVWVQFHFVHTCCRAWYSLVWLTVVQTNPHAHT